MALITPKKSTKLIIEIKPHSTPQLEKAAATKAIETVAAHNAQNMVEYISFSSVICEAIIAKEPQAKVSYLDGTLNPVQLKAKGYSGLDYHMDVLRNNPRWIDQAHNLGLTVNVWTVNDSEDFDYFLNIQSFLSIVNIIKVIGYRTADILKKLYIDYGGVGRLCGKWDVGCKCFWSTLSFPHSLGGAAGGPSGRVRNLCGKRDVGCRCFWGILAFPHSFAGAPSELHSNDWRISAHTEAVSFEEGNQRSTEHQIPTKGE